MLFWDHFEKVVFCPYIWEYQHLRYFEITLKMSFFAHISENFNISRQITLFWDLLEKVVFYPYNRKYQYCEKNYVFEITFKNRLLPKISSVLKTYFCPYLRKYRNSDVSYVFWDHFEKIVFCPYLRKYQNLRVKHFFEIIFKKKSLFVYKP